MRLILFHLQTIQTPVFSTCTPALHTLTPVAIHLTCTQMVCKLPTLQLHSSSFFWQYLLKSILLLLYSFLYLSEVLVGSITIRQALKLNNSWPVKEVLCFFGCSHRFISNAIFENWITFTWRKKIWMKVLLLCILTFIVTCICCYFQRCVHWTTIPLRLPMVPLRNSGRWI